MRLETNCLVVIISQMERKLYIYIYIYIYIFIIKDSRRQSYLILAFDVIFRFDRWAANLLLGSLRRTPL